jgi:hypothetical protein
MFSISKVNEGWGRYFPWLNAVDSIAFGPENIPPPFYVGKAKLNLLSQGYILSQLIAIEILAPSVLSGLLP